MRLQVLGAGPIGLLVVQLLRLVGVSRIHVIEPVAFRAQAALANGASSVSAGPDGALDATEGRGNDLVVEATNSPAGFGDAVLAARTGGRLVLVGIPDGNHYAAMPADVLRRRALGIKMSRRMCNVMPDAIRLVDDGAVNVDAMITHRYHGLHEVGRAFADQARLADGVIKSIVHTRRS